MAIKVLSSQNTLELTTLLMIETDLSWALSEWKLRSKCGKINWFKNVSLLNLLNTSFLGIHTVIFMKTF